MGSKQSVLSEEQLDEYVQLTYLTKTEVMHIVQKFRKLQSNPKAEPDVLYRYTIEDVVREFPVLNYNPFRGRIFNVFSSCQDGRLSFEDFLDLSSAMSINCPLRVKATWAFKLFDFNEDNQITREDLCSIIDRLTLEPHLRMDEKYHICEILLKEMDLQHTGGISQLEFIHAISKMPEFEAAFAFRL